MAGALPAELSVHNGEEGIRTLETIPCLHGFQPCSFGQTRTPLRYLPFSLLIKAKALFSEHSLCTAPHLPILAASDPATTFGVIELNFCVRNGNRCVLYAINTTPLSYSLKTK